MWGSAQFVPGFFTMAAPVGRVFTGLEFNVGSGWLDPSSWSIVWTAFLGGVQVGNGSIASFVIPSTVGFSSVSGFDELRYTELRGWSPAFDEVRAQYGGQEVVPEPATMTLLATGLAGMAVARRRKKLLA